MNSILAIILLNNIYNLVTLHPFQYVYFNSIFEKKANKLFEIDYWGLSNKFSLEKIVKDSLILKIVNIRDNSNINVEI